MRRSVAALVIIAELLWPVSTAHEQVLAMAAPVIVPTPAVYERPVLLETNISRGSQSRSVEMVIQATAYTHTGHKTFTETWPHHGTIAVDPRYIPLGSEIYVEGYGWGKAEDTGKLIKGQIIDLFMETKSEALTWGRHNVRIKVIPPKD